jgi:hypothetical protein
MEAICDHCPASSDVHHLQEYVLTGFCFAHPKLKV